MTDTNLSRRRLLASMPAAAAVMAPAAAGALGGRPTGDDAELIALGRKLEPLVVEIKAARAIDRQHLNDFNARLAALGLKDESEYEDHDAWWAERVRLIHANEEALRDEANRPSDHRDWDDLHDDLFALTDDILAIRPTTLEGFTIQVLAIITAHDDLCDEDVTWSCLTGWWHFSKTCADSRARRYRRPGRAILALLRRHCGGGAAGD
jgi:hypothetical protein